MEFECECIIKKSSSSERWSGRMPQGMRLEITHHPLTMRHVVNLQCTLTDSQKRALIMMEDTMELHAIRLQGGSIERQVGLSMSTYLDPMPSAEAQPVTLGIRGTKYFLSCSKNDDRPTLNIEEVEDKADLRSISKDGDKARFLFYRSVTGLSASSFMSARYSGWMISTAPEDNLRVNMCLPSEGRYQTFTLR
ncbi:hypothetical protein CRUP_022961 [Coryphaenoides rupestris]|nr:hypothetical protein CRUP_022961 [Coryphaenoides rupestris]